jgi:hypothetical protein
MTAAGGLLSGLVLLLVVGSSLGADPVPADWPPLFHAILKQNRSGDLAAVDLFYDYEGGRNLNIIRDSTGMTGSSLCNLRA